MKTTKELRKLNFHLLYLALLTKERIKPLSRWEKPLSKNEIILLKKLGLKVNRIERKTLTGKSTYEFIFSKSYNYLNYYQKNFDHTLLSQSGTNMRKQGFLFGYPSCCVENFIHNGYTKNRYIGKEQEILFHWVCPDCRITPCLIPYYQKIHNECRAIQANEKMLLSERMHQFSRKLIPAAAAVLIFAGMPSFSNAQNISKDNPHWLVVEGDEDNDYLSYNEETLLGTHYCYFFDPDVAGPHQALQFKTIIDSLQVATHINHPDTTCYKVEIYAYGYYPCPICGEMVNMGYVDICNPMRGLSIQIPFMGLHFLEQGSFSYQIEDDEYRIDIGLLKKVLSPYDAEHLSIPTNNDTDNDGLNNPGEFYVGTEPYNPDTNDNAVDDGQETAETVAEFITNDNIELIFIPAYGYETCNYCGQIVNMGIVEIKNLDQGTSMTVPIIALHYLAHGRFAYDGTANQGEVDPVELCEVLGLNFTGVDDMQKIAKGIVNYIKNYPNPFNPQTTISFSLSQKDIKDVKLDIYNINGELIRTLDCVESFNIKSEPTKSVHSIIWNGTDNNSKTVPSGVYLYQLKLDDEIIATKKCVLMK